VSLPEPASFRISEDDHYALNKLMFNRTLKPLKIFLLALLPIVALSIIIDVALKRSIIDDLMPLGVGGLVGCFAVFVMSASLKRNARKVYRESASLQEEMTLVFEEDGFRIEHQSGSWRVEWR
jgi:glycopeptide antibiotics resistance protein